MITYYWALGIFFTILIFAGKAGLVAGSIGIRATNILGLALIYGIFAFLMGVFLKIFNPLDYFQFFQKFMSYGVILHVFLSVGLLAWGLYTIKSYINNRVGPASNAGYLLILPCPICLSAMLLSCSIFVAVTGTDPLKAGGFLAVLFMASVAGSALLTRKIMRRSRGKTSGPLLLGFVMVMVGLYFAVSVMVVPVYSQLKSFLTVSGNMAVQNMSPKELAGLLLISGIIFGVGFFMNRKEFQKKYQ